MRFGRLLLRDPHFFETGLRLSLATTIRWQVRKLSRRFDVIEAPDWMAPALLLSWTSRVPLVVSLHTPATTLWKHSATAIGLDHQLADRLERLQARRAKAIISASQLMVDELRESRWFRQPPMIIRYPVELQLYERLRSAAETPPTVLYVGRLEARKGPEILIAAAARLQPRIPDLHVVFYGSSSGARNGQPYGTWIREHAATLKVNASFVEKPTRDDLDRSFGGARVVAVPSRFESFSIVALEAMASSRPVVCTDRVGAAELLRGTTAGEVVPVGEPDALAASLLPYLADPVKAAAAGATARQIVEAECRPSKVAAERESCYRASVGPPPDDVETAAV